LVEIVIWCLTILDLYKKAKRELLGQFVQHAALQNQLAIHILPPLLLGVGGAQPSQTGVRPGFSVRIFVQDFRPGFSVRIFGEDFRPEIYEHFEGCDHQIISRLSGPNFRIFFFGLGHYVLRYPHVQILNAPISKIGNKIEKSQAKIGNKIEKSQAKIEKKRKKSKKSGKNLEKIENLKIALNHPQNTQKCEKTLKNMFLGCFEVFWAILEKIDFFPFGPPLGQRTGVPCYLCPPYF